MMLAEKAADLILGNSPLPPIDAEFYRHVCERGVTSQIRLAAANSPFTVSFGG
jgi:hypothetical protein